MRTFLKWWLPLVVGVAGGIGPQAIRGEVHWTWQFILLLVAGLVVIQVAAVAIDVRLRHRQRSSAL